jgi:SpoVK/Ycf46/Vps4 family AAA+-type ATPase
MRALARSLRHAHGTSALFSGPSGTGKTLAAEVLARDLGLDLWRVDLSAVVSKYIGETEKNLGRVFDAAERSGAVLLFEEADALFGSRSEVKDSHDRYANLEVAYLLQRLEQHAGLTILTTNLRHAIDPAFTRRLLSSFDFPLPRTTHAASRSGDASSRLTARSSPSITAASPGWRSPAARSGTSPRALRFAPPRKPHPSPCR